jgi:hypothetical protein
LSSACLSASSCCSSWHRRWTLLFWDLVKPSRHHCKLGFLCVNLILHHLDVRCIDAQGPGTWCLHQGSKNRPSLPSDCLTFHWLGSPADHERWPCPLADRGHWPWPQPIVDWDPLITEFMMIFL